ncbi:MAG: sigma-70 family RNA polymerase sigma factor [Flavobacteriales bacterium]|jgi:RNA polymerase sigma factor (sigma-70 family)|nr:sigma-70 family RNA polymerase sigma factor [Flavobacteriales bacterium]
MRVQQMTDRQLVEIYYNGKEEGFEELLKRYKSRVFGKIMMYVKDRAVAEDIFQDTFVRAIHALKEGNYNEEGKFSAWVMRIAHNLCIDYFRGKKKMPVTRERDDYNPFDYISSNERNSEDEKVNAEVLTDAKRLLNYLPMEQKEIVMMRLYYDMSFKEISEQLDISINTALGRMRYALINLRKLIEKHQMEMTLS